ncbi:IclR family transcriptional regulator domain-containing protein [Herbidospora cretacea]|uniref:IclR family transcriptional regulator domain-containing protein n=1 Tax=Herbidospora cretacea TaxID=28444 RepID=UPI00077355D2|nr:IclR family transcriptional regulator C-terminal domain-containing protein [Herbidospora cretacea]
MTDDPVDATVGPLERGLAVLKAMAAGEPCRPSDLTRATGLARSTVDRVLATLVAMGFARSPGPDRSVRLTPRVLAIGNTYLSGSGVPDALGPEARRLAEDLDESVSLAVADGTAVRFVTQLPRRRSRSLTFRVGDLLPAERCAAGALLAAEWTEARWARWRTGCHETVVTPDVAAEQDFRDRAVASLRRGHALDDQLIEPGLIAVAVPVRCQGRVVCAVSVVSHTSRHTVESLAGLALPRLDTARMEHLLAAHKPSPARPIEIPGDTPVQSLSRGLAVLTALGGTLSEIAEATGLARATARRALLTLVALGYAARSGNRFVARPKVLELGFARLSSLTLGEIATPHLTALAEAVGESASVAVLDGTDIRYVARAPAYKIMSVDVTVGTRFPAYATSMGRVLLADDADLGDLRPLTRHTVTDPGAVRALIRKARADGHAIVVDELEEGLRALGVPIRDRDGHVVAAVNVAMTGQVKPGLLAHLQATAHAVETDLALVTERTPLRPA